MNEGQITDRRAARDYMLSGAAIFTLRSVETDVRYTFRVRIASGKAGLWFVDLLTGPDNESDYAFVGVIRSGAEDDLKVIYSPKSSIPFEALSIKAIKWIVPALDREGPMPRGVEFWHSGKCGRCGRMLTDPVSIETGLGPVCRTKV